jgi:2-amino-4-hydroxy-6-hydroxymethyldihydropteridine diphosphokinase
MVAPVDVVVGLGGNIGERRAVLASAVEALRAVGDVAAVSRLYETPPFGPPQPAYLNAAVRLNTELGPGALLESLLDIERRHGRERREKWGPRTLDLDILWIAGSALDEPSLTVPHARLHERLFALLPLLDVAPDASHPVTLEPFREWVAALPPDSRVRVVAAADWAAPNGTPRAELKPP